MPSVLVPTRAIYVISFRGDFHLKLGTHIRLRYCFFRYGENWRERKSLLLAQPRQPHYWVQRGGNEGVRAKDIAQGRRHHPWGWRSGCACFLPLPLGLAQSVPRSVLHHATPDSESGWEWEKTSAAAPSFPMDGVVLRCYLFCSDPFFSNTVSLYRYRFSLCLRLGCFMGFRQNSFFTLFRPLKIVL